MLSVYRSIGFMTAVAALAGCGSATPEESARMDASAQLNAPGARGVPSAQDMEALGYFRTSSNVVAKRGELMKTANTR
jgi:hypothetical protein